MQLFTGSAAGTPRFVTPVQIDLRDLVEGTDFGAYDGTNAEVETYAEGTANELKCVLFSMKTADGLSAVGPVGSANELIPVMSIVQSGNDFMQDMPFDAVTGTQPSDWELHCRDWYYKSEWTETSGPDTMTLYGGQTAADEVWNSGNTYYKNTQYSNLFWTLSGGCFAAGTYIQRFSAGVYCLMASAGARVGIPGTGNVCYPTHGGQWEPRFRGISQPEMFYAFGNTNRHLETSWKQDIVNFSENTGSAKIVLCSFVYDGKNYFGCALLRYDIDDSLQYCGVWGISENWWNSPGSRYNYTVDPDGSTKKAINPNYTKSTGSWGQSGLPADGTNRLVTGANYISVGADGTPYGYATYSLTRADFNTCIRVWTNKLSSFLGTVGDWYDRVKNGAGYVTAGVQTLISNPLESILKAHTVPVPAALIPTYTTTWANLPEVRSGGCGTGIDTKGVLVDNDGRIVEIDCNTSLITRKTGWFSDWTHTHISVYVPMVGEIPLKAEDVLNHVIYCRYRIDIMTGDFTATIANEYSNIYTASGNCSIPVVCSSSATLQERALHSISGAIQSGVQIAAASSVGNVPGIVSGLASGLQNLTQSMQQHVSYSQTGGDGMLFSGLYTPCLMVRRPNPVTGDIGNDAGYMSGTVGKIAKAQVTSGKSFLRVQAVDLTGVNASAEEKAEIERLLKEGVYV